jgi:vancomycin resistance protein YoaR
MGEQVQPAVATDPVVGAPPVPATGSTEAARGRGRGRRLVLALLALLVPVLVVAAAAGGLYAWDAGYQGRILPGVSIGDVDLSGRTRDEAVALVAAAYPFETGRLVLRTPAGDLEIPYAAVGRRADADGLVDEAMMAGRREALPERLLVQLRQALEGSRIAPRDALVDDEALARAITTALATLDRAPIDATIAMGEDGPVTTPARPGATADPAPVIAAASAALVPVHAPDAVVVEVEPVALPPTVGDAAVAEAATRVARILGDVEVTWRKEAWTIRERVVRRSISFQARTDGSVAVVVDPETLAEALRKPRKAVRKDPVNALFLRARGGRPVGVVASQNGRELDGPETAARIAAELEARGTGQPAASVAVAVTRLEPRLTTEEATRKAPRMVNLGSWTTYFPISERNAFGANIWRPAELIDGTVLSPGESFDWWDAIWPVTTARGFGMGGIIRTDHTDPTGALGGGMCSSSTTLFNAAMRAGLRMGQRHNHRYYIDRYPLGLDATVSIVGGHRQSMTFTNDMREPVVIRAFRIRRGGAGYVRYQIWGIPDGRTVSVSRASVANVSRATTRVVEVTTLPRGVREQTEYPSNGMDTAVTRVVRAANGRVLHRDTWRSHYVRWDGRIEVGV